MTIYYGVVGTNASGSDATGSNLWDGWIVMNGPRPDGEYYADEDGEWKQGVSPLAKVEAIEAAKAAKVDKMSRATGIISTLQDAIEAGVAGEEESLSLPLWKEYRLALYRVDVTLAPDITWPVAPDELPVVIEEVLMEPVAKVKFSM